FAGTLASGRLAVGDPVVVVGSGRETRVERIVSFEGDLEEVSSGRSVTLTLADDVDVARGDLLVDPRHRPLEARRFSADLVWMDDTAASARGDFLLKIGTATLPATVNRIVDMLDVETLERTPAGELGLNAIGRVWIEASASIAFDPYTDNRETGGLILIDRTTLRTVAAGVAIDSLAGATNVHRQAVDVTPIMREEMKGQRALVLWLTGLPGAGKSTIA